MKSATTSFGSEMFAEYIDWRIDHPADDLMTELLHTEFEDEHGHRAHADARRDPHCTRRWSPARATRRRRA